MGKKIKITAVKIPKTVATELLVKLHN